MDDGLFVPGKGIQVQAERIVLKLFNDPSNPDAAAEFILPRPNSPDSMRQDTMARMLVHLLDQAIATRLMLGNVIQSLNALSSQLEQQERHRQTDRVANMLHTGPRVTRPEPR